MNRIRKYEIFRVSAARGYNKNNTNKAKKPDRKPDSNLVLKNLTKKIRETKRLKSTGVSS